MALTSEHVRQFSEDGLLVLESVLSESDLAGVETALEDILREDRSDVSRDVDNGVVKMIHGCHLLDGRFLRLTQDARLAEPAQQLLDAPAYVYQSRLNLKPAFETRAASGYPWHQDFSTWRLRDQLPEPRAVTAFTFLDDVTACNAPVMAVVGSHREGLIVTEAERAAAEEGDRFQPRIPPETLARLARQGGVRALVGPRGSVAFMHGNALHASTENISPFRRAIYSSVYCAAGNHPRRFRAPEWFVARDFTPLPPGPNARPA